ncbi:hypothetical protein NFI00_000130 [Salmonella enterica]|nr:hypothetical protein [Salmonella enterica subsp. enterica serovar Minnesota]EJI5696427.1 hypothetical protein [Salmonella enterica]
MNEGKGLIVEHHELHTVFDILERHPAKTFSSIMAVGGGSKAGIIRSNLEWDEKHQLFTGKTWLASPLLKGVKNLHLPVLSLIPATRKIMLTFNLNGRIFTQQTNDEAYGFFKQTRGFSRHYLDVLGKRVEIAIQDHNKQQFIRIRYESISLEHLDDLLKHGEVVKTYPVRKETWTVIPEVRKEEFPTIDEIKYDGLLVRRAIHYFNGGRLKEETEYYVIEATGIFHTYRGTQPDFKFHERVGYVNMTPLASIK